MHKLTPRVGIALLTLLCFVTGILGTTASSAKATPNTAAAQRAAVVKKPTVVKTRSTPVIHTVKRVKKVQKYRSGEFKGWTSVWREYRYAGHGPAKVTVYAEYQTKGNRDRLVISTPPVQVVNFKVLFPRKSTAVWTPVEFKPLPALVLKKRHDESITDFFTNRSAGIFDTKEGYFVVTRGASSNIAVDYTINVTYKSVVRVGATRVEAVNPILFTFKGTFWEMNN